MKRRDRHARELASRIFFVQVSLGRSGTLAVEARANSNHEALRQGLSKAYAEVSAEARKDVHVLSVKEVELCGSYI